MSKKTNLSEDQSSKKTQNQMTQNYSVKTQLRETQQLQEIQLARKIFFSAAHFYKNENWSDEKNREVFGACFSPYGHGHNYTLECYFTGYIENKTGLVINLFDVDTILKRVVAPFDHHHINYEVEAFKSKIPTTENLAVWFFEELKREMITLPVKLIKVRLSEEDDLWVDYPAF